VVFLSAGMRTAAIVAETFEYNTAREE